VRSGWAISFSVILVAQATAIKFCASGKQKNKPGLIETDNRHDLTKNHRLYGISLRRDYSLDAIYGEKVWQHRNFPLDDAVG